MVLVSVCQIHVFCFTVIHLYPYSNPRMAASDKLLLHTLIVACVCVCVCVCVCEKIWLVQCDKVRVSDIYLQNISNINLPHMAISFSGCKKPFKAKRNQTKALLIRPIHSSKLK